MEFIAASQIIGILAYAGAGVLGAIILGVGKAAMNLLRSRQTRMRDDEFDQRTLSEFFFDTPRDPRTGAPAKEGWTTKVDRTLGQLTSGQAQTTRAIHEVLRELKPDNNGGHNLRGIVERNAAARSEDTDGTT